ncbi:MAG: hypothetical protein SynsKO_14940 [Synoicihabitans sp.]
MEHGPFISSTIATDPYSPRSILVHKGIAVRVSEDPGATFVFDTDLLRMVAVWTGGNLHWYPGRDGYQEWPSPEGFIQAQTNQRPGWSVDGKFSDPRPWKYGPVPAKLGEYHGLYLNGDRVVFSYRVGSAEILESPSYADNSGSPVFDRAFNIQASEETLSLHVLTVPEGANISLQQDNHPDRQFVTVQAGNQSRHVGYANLPEGSLWRIDRRHLILDLPPLQSPLQFHLSLGPVSPARATSYMLEHTFDHSEPIDLAPFTEPGPKQWETLQTTMKRGEDSGAFALDELTVPHDNPWNAFMRLSGLDFLSDGSAVVSSMSGDVWIVEGIQQNRDTLTWRRFATGLNQPLGVKVVDDQIYVTGRDQITRLHDRDGNGEADFYENFNNEVMAATNFHAFTLNLETDDDGNFYFAKATPWPPERNGVKAEVTPHHGALFRLSPDGEKLDVIAHGLRNPNGLSLGPDGEIHYSDNEGNWVPTSKVHRIVEDDFHGFVPSDHREGTPDDFVKPILWVPHFVDNSPSTPIYLNNPNWPNSLQDHLLLTSYGRGNLSLILREEIEGQSQAAHLNLPITFQSGAHVGRFHSDGNLYVAGLTSWQSVGHGGDWGSLHRVRYTGRPLHLPVAVNTLKGGLEFKFDEPLAPEAVNSRNYSLTQWTYPWTSQYGTRGKVYSVLNPGREGPDPVEVTAITLSPDAKTLRFEIPQLRQRLVQTSLAGAVDLPDIKDTPMGLIVAIEASFPFADGTSVPHVIHKTIHRVPDDALEENVHNETRHGPATLRPARPSPSETIDTDARIIDLASTGITLAYDKTEIRARAGERLAIRYTNASDMIHNIVLVRSDADIQPVGVAAIAARADEFIPASEATRILAHSRLAYPGDVVVMEFTVPAPGTYPYICTFSGHFTMMQGKLIVEP